MKPTVLRIVRVAMAIVTVVAVVAQLVRATDNPLFRPINYFSYFTILSNIGAIVVLGSLAVRPKLVADERFMILRGAVTCYMVITGLVYNLLLAPQAANVSTELEWVNSVVHFVGPVVVTADWFVDRSPIKPTVAQAASWLIFPAVWLAYTMIRGPLADWYPYPFLNADVESTGSIIVTCIGIMVAFIAVAAVLRWGSGADQPDRTPSTILIT